MPLPFQGDQGVVHRHLPLYLFRMIIAYRIALFHPSQPLYSPGGVEQRFRQAGFSGAAMGYYGQISCGIAGINLQNCPLLDCYVS